MEETNRVCKTTYGILRVALYFFLSYKSIWADKFSLASSLIPEDVAKEKEQRHEVVVVQFLQ